MTTAGDRGAAVGDKSRWVVRARAGAARRTRSTSPCTRPRTCRRSWPTGWSSSRYRRARIRATRSAARRRCRSWHRARGSEPAACGGRRRSARRGRTSRSWRCAATSTPGCESSPTGSATRSCSRWPASRGWRVWTRPAAFSTSSSRPPARERSRSRRVPAALASPGLIDEDATACVTAERELTRALGASCNTPVGAHAQTARRRRDRAHGLGWPSRRLGVGQRSTARPAGWAWATLVADRLLAVGRGGAAVVTVYLVGAGPGDPGLLTARALELIAAADVIVYDRLIPATALDGARPDATLIYAGKEGGGPSMPQAEIDRAADHARRVRGATVVRLKGGDPFVFGRGGEEAEALREAGVAFEVVPGVTAGVAGAGVRRDPGHPSRRRQRGRVRHRARGPDQGRARRSIGRRWPRSRERSCSTWASGSSPAIASALIAGGRDGAEPAARGRARHAVRSAGGGRDARDDRGGSGRGGDPGAGARRRRRGRRSEGAAGVVRVAAARRPDRRRDAGARPGERTRGAAGGSRRGRRRGAGDPDRAARRAGAGARRLRPRVPDEPERRAAAV